MDETSIIVNPAAGGGSGRRVIGRIEAAFASLSPRFFFTEREQEEEELAFRAARSGSETIVVVGGDGTWGNAAHGIIASGASPRVALLAAGTGNDFVKSVAAPAHDPAATAAMIRSGLERRIDVGLAGDRVFLNCCGIGFDTSVLERSNRIRFVRGAARYLLAALAEIMSYRSEEVRIEPWENERSSRTLLTVFANGAWYGGMFHIAPRASPDDGLLEAIRIGDVRGLHRLALLRGAISGAHVHHPDVDVQSGRTFNLRFNSPPLVNCDGELRMAANSELTIGIMPGALRLVAPPRPATPPAA